MIKKPCVQKHMFFSQTLLDLNQEIIRIEEYLKKTTDPEYIIHLDQRRNFLKEQKEITINNLKLIQQDGLETI